MEVRWSSAAGTALAVMLALAACGGDEADVGADLSPQAEEARQIAIRYGCAACHGSNGGGGTGPAWVGSFGTEIDLEDGSTVTVDEAYLTTAIADPDAQVRSGFSIAMPENQLSDDEIAKIVAYIRELGAAPGGTES